jgi:integrase
MSTQVRALLVEQRERNITAGRSTGPDDYVFKTYGRRAARVSDSTLNKLFERIGSPITPHGLRSTGATLMEGRKADPVVIEMCLAHAKKGIVAVYQRHGRMDERRALLQEYADAVEALAGGANVTGIDEKRAA